MVDSSALAFSHPLTAGLYGVTGAGKTFFMRQVLTEPGLIIPKPDKIYWFYSEDQPLYKNLENVEFVEGLPTREHYDGLNKEMRNVYIIDDLMTEALKCEFISSLFSRGSHHRNLSLWLLSQNIFCGGKMSRNIALNTKYVILFANPRDPNQIKRLGSQIFPDHKDFLPDAYKQAMQQPYGHLIIALDEKTPKQLRVRSQLFDPVQAVYLPRKK